MLSPQRKNRDRMGVFLEVTSFCVWKLPSCYRGRQWTELLGTTGRCRTESRGSALGHTNRLTLLPARVDLRATRGCYLRATQHECFSAANVVASPSNPETRCKERCWQRAKTGTTHSIGRVVRSVDQWRRCHGYAPARGACQRPCSASLWFLAVSEPAQAWPGSACVSELISQRGISERYR